MTAPVLAFLLALAELVFSYPGAVFTGKVVAKDGTQCRLVLWEGLAPYPPLLSESEQKSLEAIVDDVKAKWLLDPSWPHRAALLSPYHRLLFDKSRELPFRRRGVIYQQFALTCAGEQVRGALVWFPPMGAGGFLVLKHAVEPEYLVLTDFEPRAKEQLEELAAFVAKYRADLEKAEDPSNLPREVRKEAASLEKSLAEKTGGRIQFWDVNGIVLPSCPGACPPGTLSYAFGQLSPRTRRAFSMALGLLAGQRPSSDSEKAPGGRLVRFLPAWPQELGENSFLGVREEMERSQKEVLSFSAPEPEIVEELWGRRTVSLPNFGGDLRKAIREVSRSF